MQPCIYSMKVQVSGVTSSSTNCSLASALLLLECLFPSLPFPLLPLITTGTCKKRDDND